MVTTNHISGYALALFQIARTNKTIMKFKIIANQLLILIRQNQSIITILNSYDLSDQTKQAIIDRSLGKIFTLEWKNFCYILSSKRHFHLIILILKKLLMFINDSLKIKSGTIYSTIPLTNQQIHQITKKTQEFIKLPVELVNKIDPTLIGGVKVVVNNQEFDYSLKARLNNLQKQLLQESGTN